MKSNELLRDFFQRHGFKIMAAVCRAQLKHLYRWCEQDGGLMSGAWNPLERLLAMMRAASDLRPLHWLCEKCNGYFVPNPRTRPPTRQDLMTSVGGVMRKLGQFQAEIALVMKDGRMTLERAAESRKQWEALKCEGERHVTESERGIFNQGQTPPVAATRRPPLKSLMLALPFWLSDTGLDTLLDLAN